MTRLTEVLTSLSRALALLGGVVLVALALMTLASIIGRAGVGLGLRPVRGDFELVQIGCAIAVFSFLPWCQMRRGHVTVDVLADRLPLAARRVLTVVGDLTLAGFAAVIARQLALGLAEKFCADTADPVFGWLWRSTGMAEDYCWVEATYELGLPVWWGYAAGLAGAGLFTLAALVTAWEAAR
ncbi:TRAP transporter small permease [Roseobacter sp. HKCCA0434]|uniref:TRAP transporter small permease n=1 Tax=Roseobacter sp. HKCCA0434 TaxID=3079297 RepID=UPI002905D267|nr:TRAP transporter small permease [Roseobacter sp. HKCCA0434]